MILSYKLNKPTAEFTGRSGAVVERLSHLYPALIDLSLGRIQQLLAKLDNPHDHLPPVIHVAGTNGKGSTCAFLYGIATAIGWRTHVSTSPHLVSVTERFRVSGHLVEEDKLISVLEEIERVNGLSPITIFEILTAAGFLLFSRNPADIVVMEVGLGGSYDATNVLQTPCVSVITPIDYDHQAFLGKEISQIAHEKAGIIKPNCPVVVACQQPEARNVIANKALTSSSPIWLEGEHWGIQYKENILSYYDPVGQLILPMPSLIGEHQYHNAGLAVAALRAGNLNLPESAYTGLSNTKWPARLQLLNGKLRALLPSDWEIWLDGGHNPHAARALAEHIKKNWQDGNLYIIVGMKQTKNPDQFLEQLLPHCRELYVVKETNQHLAIETEELYTASKGRAIKANNLEHAILSILSYNTPRGRILICGSLYLAGIVLEKDGWLPH